MQQRTAGPRVAQRQLAVSLAQRAASAAQTEGNRHHGVLSDRVLLDRLHADHRVHARTAARADEAHGDVELVGHALQRLPLARQRARTAQARVDALRRVHHAMEKSCSPLARHFFFRLTCFLGAFLYLFLFGLFLKDNYVIVIPMNFERSKTPPTDRFFFL